MEVFIEGVSLRVCLLQGLGLRSLKRHLLLWRISSFFFCCHLTRIIFFAAKETLEKSEFPALPSRHFQSVFLWLVSWGKDKRLHKVSFSTLMKPVLPAHSFKLLLQCAAGSARQVSVALGKEAEENIYDFLDRQLDKTSGIQSIRITCFSSEVCFQLKVGRIAGTPAVKFDCSQTVLQT